MYGLTTGEIIGGILAIAQFIFIFVNRETFKRGQNSVKLEQIEKLRVDITSAYEKLNKLGNDMAEYRTRTNQIETDNRSQELAIREIQLSVSVQNQRSIHMERLLEKVNVQHAEFQKNLQENTNALSRMSGAIDGVKQLLQDLIHKKLTIS